VERREEARLMKSRPRGAPPPLRLFQKQTLYLHLQVKRLFLSLHLIEEMKRGREAALGRAHGLLF